MKNNNTKRFMALFLSFVMIAASGILNTGSFLFANESDADTPDTQVVEEVATEEVAVDVDEAEAEEAAADETAGPAASDESADVAEEAAEETAAAEEAADAADDADAAADAETAEAEEAEEVAEGVVEDIDAAFSQSAQVNGVKITVTADKGVFPEGAKLNVKSVSGSKFDKAEAAVADEAEGILGELLAFDITITDEDGKEIQPDTARGEVTVAFAKAAVMDKTDADSADELHVYHMNDSLSNAEELDASVSGSEISVEADHFSVYIAGVEYATLKAAAAAAKDGDEIDLNEQEVEVNSQVIVNGKQITIKNGTIKRAEGYKYKLIKVGNGANLTLKDVTLVGNEGDYENLVFADGSSVLNVEDGTVFKDNKMSGDYGAAIYAMNSTVNINGGKFTGNSTTQRGGGAVYVCESKLSITGGTFESNKAKTVGGAVSAVNSEVSISGGTFSGNIAGGNGGAVAVSGKKSSPGSLSITGGEFTGNKGNIGGAVYVGANSYITALSDATFTGNTAAKGSGAVEAKFNQDLNVQNVEFKNNTASGVRAGALYLSEENGNNLTIDNCTFEGNSAADWGGALWLKTKGSQTVKDCTFSGNSSQTKGGAYYVDCSGSPTGSILLEGNTFNGNKADEGGAVYFAYNKGTATITDDNYYLNEATTGGAIYLPNGTTLNINGNTNIHDNTASQDGGGIYVFESTVTAEGGMIYGNTAGNDGGGIYLYNSTLQTNNEDTNTMIYGNKASGNGGGIYAKGASVIDLDNTDIGDSEDGGANSARNGGGIYATGSTEIKGESLYVNYNTAENNGGGIYLTNNATYNMDDESNAVSYNTAKSDGGGIYLDGVSMDFSAGTVEGNKAESDGGGIYITDSDAELNISDSASIISNTAKINGGGVCAVESSTVNMSGGSIGEDGGNSAVNGGGVYVNSKAVLNMTGGVIDSNEASYGGGICGAGTLNNGSGTINITGGEITNNTVKGYGGGIGLGGKATATLDGGTISGNTAYVAGGGVCTYRLGNPDNPTDGGIADTYGIFYMKSGKITGNEASYHGGGICLYGNPINSDTEGYSSLVEMTGGEVTGNKATYGGGVYVASSWSNKWDWDSDSLAFNLPSESVFAMNGGSISDNEAGYGDAVFVLPGGKFYLDLNSSVTIDGKVFLSVYGGYSGQKSAETPHAFVYLIGGDESHDAVMLATSTSDSFNGRTVVRPGSYSGKLVKGSKSDVSGYDEAFSHVTMEVQADENPLKKDERESGWSPDVKDLILYKTTTYTVAFDANDGEGTMSDQEMTVGETAALNANEFTRDGYTFTGWNTEKDGSGDSYDNKQEVTDIAGKGETITLYAQWTKNAEEPKTHTANVKYQDEDGNKVSDDKSVTFKTGDKGIEIEIPKVDGYTPSKVIVNGKEITVSAGETTKAIEFTGTMSDSDFDIVVVYAKNETTPDTPAATTDDDDDDDDNTITVTTVATTGGGGGGGAAAAPAAAAAAAVPATVIAVDADDDGDVELAQVEDVETPAALLEDEHLCNLIPFLLMAIAMVVEAFNNKNSKNHKKRMEDMLGY